MGGFEMIGNIVGGKMGADASRDAARTQANATKEAAQISRKAAEEARAEILDRMAPALATFRREMGLSANTIINGETSIMDVLQRSTGQANQLLSNAGADAMAALMGSRASAQGVPRQTFEQQYAAGAYTGGAPPQYVPYDVPTAPQPTAPQPAAALAQATQPAMSDENLEKLAYWNAVKKKGIGSKPWAAPPTDAEILREKQLLAENFPTAAQDRTIQPTGDIVRGLAGTVAPTAQKTAAEPTTAEQIAAQDYAANRDITNLAGVAAGVAGQQIGLPGVSQMPQIDTSGIGFGGATEAIQRGLIGGLAAMQAGTGQARADIAGGREAAIGALTGAQEQAMGRYAPYSEAGQAAIQKEAALSGALGPEAQAAAQAEYTESPGQKYLREQQEKALLRSAAATGGLGGGRVLSALQEQAAGIAGQQQQQYLENLRSIAGRGQQVAGAEAGLISGTGSQIAGIQQQAAGNLANLAQQLGMSSADLMRMSEGEQAALAERTGVNVASLQQTIQQAQAANQLALGQGLANIRAGTTADISGIQQGLAGTGLSAQQNISQILSNLATQSGTNLANLAVQRGAAQAAGTAAAGNIWGNVAQNLGQISEAGANRYLANQNWGGYGGYTNPNAMGGAGYYGNEAIQY